MKILAVIIAILALFVGWAKPVNLGMTAHTVKENNITRGTFLMFQGFEVACGMSICATDSAAQKAVDDCVRHCIQNALSAVGEVAALILAPFTHSNLIVFFTLIGFLAQVALAYAFFYYLFYAYTLFHLRFVTSTVLRN